MQNLRLQAIEELFLESGSRDQQPIRANAVPAVGVHRTAVARILAPFPLPGNERDAAMANGALQKPGEQIRRACISAEARSPFDDVHPLTSCSPQFLGDNALLRDLAAAPLVRNLSPIDPLARFL